MTDIRLRIEARDLPGRKVGKHRDGVVVGVQRRGRPDEVLDPVPSDSTTATWEFAATVEPRDEGFDVRGPYVQGGPGARFVYLSWCTREGDALVMFGRSKLLLSAVAHSVLAQACETGLLVGSIGLVDERGKLRMAAIKPPAIEWSAGS